MKAAWFEDSYESKSRAQSAASRRREQGYRVTVVRRGQFWVVRSFKKSKTTSRAQRDDRKRSGIEQFFKSFFG